MRPSALVATASLLAAGTALAEPAFPVPDTAQDVCFDNSAEVACRAPGEVFRGQDAQHDGVQPSYTDNGDVTGLMWAQEDSGDALNWQEALVWVEARNAESHLGHEDWRLAAGYSVLQRDGRRRQRTGLHEHPRSVR